MRFKQEKEKMLRILRACDAPAEIIAVLEAICHHWLPNNGSIAEDLLLEICAKFNFSLSWQVGDRKIVFRPYSVSRERSAFLPDHSTTPDGEQSYRRGFHQGAARILNEPARGRSVAELKLFAQKLSLWRRQAVQYRFAIPGSVCSERLPAKWDDI